MITIFESNKNIVGKPPSLRAYPPRVWDAYDSSIITAIIERAFFSNENYQD